MTNQKRIFGLEVTFFALSLIYSAQLTALGNQKWPVVESQSIYNPLPLERVMHAAAKPQEIKKVVPAVRPAPLPKPKTPIRSSSSSSQISKPSTRTR